MKVNHSICKSLGLPEGSQPLDVIFAIEKMKSSLNHHAHPMTGLTVETAIVSTVIRDALLRSHVTFKENERISVIETEMLSALIDALPLPKKKSNAILQTTRCTITNGHYVWLYDRDVYHVASNWGLHFCIQEAQVKATEKR